MTRAMLLCAGLGTRLAPLTDERPKPMLPVCDAPILRYGVAHLAGHGIRDIAINLHHLGDVIERELGDGSALGVRITYIREATVLGTGGGLRNALHALDPDGADEPFVSMNGKLIFDVDVTAMVAAYRAAAGALGMLAVRRVSDALAWGAVDVRAEPDGGLRVADILGRGEHMFGGVHVTRPSVVRRLPDGEACMIRQGYLPWLRAGERVAAFEAGGGYFAEHSTPARLLQSSVDLLRGAAIPFPPQALRGVDAGARVHEGARIVPPVRVGSGAEIGAGAVVGPDVVVGAGAQVAPGARLERVVVWPGARADGDHRDRVITPRAVVAAT